MACHLAEFAVLAAPDDARAHELRVAAYDAHAGAQTSSMARKVLAHAAASSRAGRRDNAGGR